MGGASANQKSKQFGSFFRYRHHKSNKGTKQESSPGGIIVWLFCFFSFREWSLFIAGGGGVEDFAKDLLILGEKKGG